MSNKIPTAFETMTKPFFEKNLKHIAGVENLSFLQLGVYTGASTEWLLKNILFGKNSTLTDVDYWEDLNDEVHKYFPMSQVENEYDEMSKQYIKDKKLTKVKKTTDDFFVDLSDDVVYDFIYIDADHKASSVMKDFLNSFKHLKSGGILAFDDYEWNTYLEKDFNLYLEPEMMPKIAIDKILTDYASQVEEIDRGWQVWVVKK